MRTTCFHRGAVSVPGGSQHFQGLGYALRFLSQLSVAGSCLSNEKPQNKHQKPHANDDRDVKRVEDHGALRCLLLHHAVDKEGVRTHRCLAGRKIALRQQLLNLLNGVLGPIPHQPAFWLSVATSGACKPFHVDKREVSR